jgi:hypothetical protein
MVPEQLLQEVNGLREGGYQVEVVEADGFANLVFRSYVLPASLSKPSSDILVKIPLSYPNGRPDMFWTDVDVLLKDGRVPRSAEAIESALGRQWRRFSWHPTTWNPGVNNILTYLEFVNDRLRRAE